MTRNFRKTAPDLSVWCFARNTNSGISAHELKQEEDDEKTERKTQKTRKRRIKNYTIQSRVRQNNPKPFRHFTKLPESGCFFFRQV